MNIKNEQGMNKIRELWQEEYGRELSLEETREIIFNLTGFFGLLEEWIEDRDLVPGCPVTGNNEKGGEAYGDK